MKRFDPVRFGLVWWTDGHLVLALTSTEIQSWLLRGVAHGHVIVAPSAAHALAYGRRAAA